MEIQIAVLQQHGEKSKSVKQKNFNNYSIWVDISKTDQKSKSNSFKQNQLLYNGGRGIEAKKSHLTEKGQSSWKNSNAKYPMSMPLQGC